MFNLIIAGVIAGFGCLAFILMTVSGGINIKQLNQEAKNSPMMFNSNK